MEKTKIKKRLIGTIVSDKMQKTVIVEVRTLKVHPKYHRRYKITSRFKVHNENKEYAVADKVIIEETRPLSKEKRWIIVSKI